MSRRQRTLRTLLAITAIAACLALRPPPNALAADPAARLPDKVLFDFEDPADAAHWSSLEPSDPEPKEPAAKAEAVAEHATSGKRSLRITFAGGTWPAVTTAHVAEVDWAAYRTFKADVIVPRACVVGFRVLQEKSGRDDSWEGAVSRWVKTEFVAPGKNTVVAALHPPNEYAIDKRYGKVVRFEIFMYEPHEGESIDVDNIRLCDEPPPAGRKREFRVVGTDLVVGSAQELEKKLKDHWKPPTPRTVTQVEGGFREKFETIKAAHPKAVLATFRDGERGNDPAHPEAVYAGWKDARWSSHGPDGVLHERATNEGRRPGHELFMRHRSPLMRVDLSSIPAGARVLAAELLIVRADPTYDQERNPEKNANVWVAEPCNRPWEEYEVNAYRYAKDKYWKAVGGMSWEGDDPDFIPLYFMMGPGQGQVNGWDCSALVQYWIGTGRGAGTDAGAANGADAAPHPNHGFMLHCSPGDWMLRAWSREAPAIPDRPALMVIYEPAAK